MQKQDFNHTPSSQAPKKERWYAEYGPLILFFVANYFFGIMWATVLFVLATIVALSVSWVLDRYIPPLTLYGGIGIIVFGGLAWILDDPFFIKIKPTLASLLLAAILVGGQLLGRNPLKALLKRKMQLKEAGWRQLSWLWTAMFLILALSNEIAWRNLSDDGWVNFKLFGLTGISLLFSLLTIPIIARHSLAGPYAKAESKNTKN